MITMESGSTPWTTGGVIAAMTVGLSVAAAVWWLCSRCRVRIELKQVVDVEKEALFRFLSDPHNLKLIHPMTTEIRVEEEREEDGGLTVTRFVWVEKLPFTIETDVRLCSDPSTSTIVFDIRPRGILEVQLKWDCSGLAENRAGSVNLVSSYSPSDQDESPAPQRHHNFSDTSQDNGVAAEAAATATRKAATAAATTHQKDEDGVISWKRERSSTLFQNYISVTGPRAAAATVAAVLRSVHLKLMNRLQQHFMTKKE